MPFSFFFFKCLPHKVFSHVNYFGSAADAECCMECEMKQNTFLSMLRSPGRDIQL